jgi:hypothetical protein
MIMIARITIPVPTLEHSGLLTLQRNRQPIPHLNIIIIVSSCNSATPTVIALEGVLLANKERIFLLGRWKIMIW